MVLFTIDPKSKKRHQDGLLKSNLSVYFASINPLFNKIEQGMAFMLFLCTFRSERNSFFYFLALFSIVCPSQRFIDFMDD